MNSGNGHRSQRGMVLISSLLLLIVVTIIALSMFRSFGIQEKIAGNMREKQRALSAAISAEEFAATWLMNSAATATLVPVACAAGTVQPNGNVGQGQICNYATALPNVLPNGDVTTVPWTVGGNPVGVTYLPANMLIGTTTSYSTANVGNPTYYGMPTYYISDMGASNDPTIPGEIYQIDAFAYGSAAATVAEVESTYVVYSTSSSPTI